MDLRQNTKATVTVRAEAQVSAPQVDLSGVPADVLPDCGAKPTGLRGLASLAPVEAATTEETVLKKVEDLCEGDMVDLESCPFLKNHPSAEFEFAEVVSMERETATCVVVGYEGIDAVGYAAGTELRVAVMKTGDDPGDMDAVAQRVGKRQFQQSQVQQVPLQKVVAILNEASAVIIDSRDGCLAYPSMADINDSDENEFMDLGWIEDGEEVYLKFLEGSNREVTLSGGSMFLVDQDGDQCQITPLFRRADVGVSLESRMEGLERADMQHRIDYSILRDALDDMTEDRNRTRELLCEALPLIEASCLDHSEPGRVSKWTHEENAKLLFGVQEKIRGLLNEA